MIRTTAFLAICLLSSLSQADAEGRDSAPLLAKVLRKYPGASRNLTEALRCLRGKQYPEDVEICGISSIGTDVQLMQIDECLTSNSAEGVATEIVGREKKEHVKLFFSMVCNGDRVVTGFEKQGKHFVVTEISFLLD